MTRFQLDSQQLLLNQDDALQLLQHATGDSLFDDHARLRAHIASIEQIPPLPAIALEILEIYRDPYGDAARLGAIIEKDPGLSAQVLRWANSALYGNPGRVVGIKEAIARVLGYEMVLNLALGLSTIKPLRVPQDGPLGLASFWANALFTATLCQQLAGHCHAADTPSRGTAYLAGLLHNLGLMLLGHFFPAEHRHLDGLLTANPQLSLSQLGEYVLGVQPSVLGLWLMQSWRLPEELTIAIAQQHNPDYRGPHAVYANLVFVSERLLKRRHLSLVHSDKIPSSLFHDLGLNVQQVSSVLFQLFQQQDGVLRLSNLLSN